MTERTRRSAVQPVVLVTLVVDDDLPTAGARGGLAQLQVLIVYVVAKLVVVDAGCFAGCIRGGILRIDRGGPFGFDPRLRTRASRNVRLFALGPPPAARDHTAVEAHGIAQLVELLLGQLARITDPQVMEREARERDPLQLIDAEPERLEHPMDLVMFALANGQRDPAVFALGR